MTGILMTQVSTPIIGQAAWLLGKIMDYIYRFMNGVLGIESIGVSIILLTIIIYTLLLPLQIKQQKFSKMSAAMNPEIQKVQKKYKGKKDQASMMKMQEETQLIYDKYGISPTGGCLSMFIQLPILMSIFYVVRNIPAYVGQVKAAYLPLINSITATDGWQKIMEGIGKAKPILLDPSRYDYTKTNTLIDVLYKFESSTWETLADKFPSLENTIESTVTQIHHMNNFLGLNIAEAPTTIIKSGIAAGTFGIVILALCVPLLAGFTQYLSVKLTASATAVDQSNPMASTMNTMNIMFPLMSVVMCFTLPTGLGIYWITSAVVRTIQMLIINKHLDKTDMSILIEQNMEKAAKKRQNKEHVDDKKINQMAHTNVKNLNKKKSAEEEKAIEAKLEEARRQNANAKPGSLASKANLVKNFNENKL